MHFFGNGKIFGKYNSNGAQRLLQMNKVAIFYICTGKYSVLWKEFYESSEELFLKDCHKEYFVFTDAESLEYEGQNPSIHRIHQEILPWPYPTLYRFKMFNTQYDSVKDFDYVFFFNANAKFVEEITADLVLPGKENGGLVVVKHPRYRMCESFDYPYDRNFKCKAYIGYGKGKVYVQGCIIGGTTEAFYKMSTTLEAQIDKDLRKNVIALWHDESYLNKYVLKHKHYKLLPPEFAHPAIAESKTKIYMRPKQNYFDVGQLKNDPVKTELSWFNKRWNHYFYTTLSRRSDFRCDSKNILKEKGRLYLLFWKLKNIWKIIFHK